jgi:hypothetical protein
MIMINNPVADVHPPKHFGAVLDDAHIGHINGAWEPSCVATSRHASDGGTLKTLLAIIGPGLIVMVGDNDAGAFGTYTQAGQNYGTTLMWTHVRQRVHSPLILVNTVARAVVLYSGQSKPRPAYHGPNESIRSDNGDWPHIPFGEARGLIV